MLTLETSSNIYSDKSSILLPNDTQEVEEGAVDRQDDEDVVEVEFEHLVYFMPHNLRLPMS